MESRELAVAGAWELSPPVITDNRGHFLEWFQESGIAEVIGHPFAPRQANLSVSSAGTLRGVHFADVPPGQAKLVTCVYGAILDVVVDVRVGSPTFGTWDCVVLDDVTRRTLYLQAGLGHAFLSLADGSTVSYLCSTPYAPLREHGIHPLDPELAITWPTTDRRGSPLSVTLSAKDGAAPTLAQAKARGILPSFEAATEVVASQRAPR